MPESPNKAMFAKLLNGNNIISFKEYIEYLITNTIPGTIFWNDLIDFIGPSSDLVYFLEESSTFIYVFRELEEQSIQTIKAAYCQNGHLALRQLIAAKETNHIKLQLLYHITQHMEPEEWFCDNNYADTPLIPFIFSTSTPPPPSPEDESPIVQALKQNQQAQTIDFNADYLLQAIQRIKFETDDSQLSHALLCSILIRYGVIRGVEARKLGDYLYAELTTINPSLFVAQVNGYSITSCLLHNDEVVLALIENACGNISELWVAILTNMRSRLPEMVGARCSEADDTLLYRLAYCFSLEKYTNVWRVILKHDIVDALSKIESDGSSAAFLLLNNFADNEEQKFSDLIPNIVWLFQRLPPHVWLSYVSDRRGSLTSLVFRQTQQMESYGPLTKAMLQNIHLNQFLLQDPCFLNWLCESIMQDEHEVLCPHLFNALKFIAEQETPSIQHGNLRDLLYAKNIDNIAAELLLIFKKAPIGIFLYKTIDNKSILEIFLRQFRVVSLGPQYNDDYKIHFGLFPKHDNFEPNYFFGKDLFFSDLHLELFKNIFMRMSIANWFFSPQKECLVRFFGVCGYPPDRSVSSLNTYKECFQTTLWCLHNLPKSLWEQPIQFEGTVTVSILYFLLKTLDAKAYDWKAWGNRVEFAQIVNVLFQTAPHKAWMAQYSGSENSYTYLQNLVLNKTEWDFAKDFLNTRLSITNWFHTVKQCGF